MPVDLLLHVAPLFKVCASAAQAVPDEMLISGDVFKHAGHLHRLSQRVPHRAQTSAATLSASSPLKKMATSTALAAPAWDHLVEAPQSVLQAILQPTLRAPPLDRRASAAFGEQLVSNISTCQHLRAVPLYAPKQLLQLIHYWPNVRAEHLEPCVCVSVQC
jgi:hypothetical protein